MSECVRERSAGGSDSLPLASTTLVLVGHGSHHSARSADPVYAHADRLRDRDVFADVRTALWKAEPSPNEVLRTVETADAIVVPLFMAAGYFTREVLPRELRLDGESAADVDGTVGYAPPVGTHDAVTDVVVERADRLVGDRDLDGEVALAIVGHGTERNAHSDAAARTHAARIRRRGRFDAVRALYLDESPSVGSLTDHVEAENVVVVPLFVADGPHTRTDVPDAAGLTADGRDDFDVPTAVDGHWVWYAGAVGTDPRLADVILDRAREVAAGGDTGRRPAAATRGTVSHASSSAESLPVVTGSPSCSRRSLDDTESPTQADRAFRQWLEGDDRGTASADEPGPTIRSGSDRKGTRTSARSRGARTRGRVLRTWGELVIAATRVADGSRMYELRHEADRDANPADLDRLGRLRDLRERVRYDDRGDFRPLRAAPTLPTGWHLPGLDGETLVRAVETVYPATIANWARERDGTLDVTHFRATADRQTGRYERLATLDRAAVESLTAACCADDACLKRRRWEYDAGEPIAVPRGEGTFPCREPCSLLLEAARQSVDDGDPVDVDGAGSGGGGR